MGVSVTGQPESRTGRPGVAGPSPARRYRTPATRPGGGGVCPARTRQTARDGRDDDYDDGGACVRPVGTAGELRSYLFFRVVFIAERSPRSGLLSLPRYCFHCKHFVERPCSRVCVRIHVGSPSRY